MFQFQYYIRIKKDFFSININIMPEYIKYPMSKEYQRVFSECLNNHFKTRNFHLKTPRALDVFGSTGNIPGKY